MLFQTNNIFNVFRQRNTFHVIIHNKYHSAPFLKLYKKTTGELPSPKYLDDLKRKHPSLECLSHDRLQTTLDILEKFNITPYEACKDPHLFCMNPITMDNYGEILRECGFITIIPKYLIRYHTMVRSRTLKQLKKEGLINGDLQLKDKLEQCFDNWPSSHKLSQDFDEMSTSILTIRMYILEKYLNWKLNVSTEEFQKYCKHYLPLKHKPMQDIQEAISIAQTDIGFTQETVRRNGFVISSDPVNTRLILDNIPTIAGQDIREAIKIEPAILKNNYNGLLQIRSILEEYRISAEAQRNCLKIYCMCPETVRERLEELVQLKEYQMLKSNPRVLSMVVHKKKMLSRLTKMNAANKQCYSLNHLISSKKVFNNYIGNFGSKACGRDIAILISTCLQSSVDTKISASAVSSETTAASIVKRLKKHKFWLHTALSVIDDNIKFLQKWFQNEVIFNNCHLLLYPGFDIQQHIEFFLGMRNSNDYKQETIPLDSSYNNIRYGKLTDDQILALTLYEIEKKYHFSGDGIWSKQDPSRTESQLS
ncbi:hypothetical protein JYU34_011056 [Plutella xylostella]|uniref:Transcription termination factor 5, mitochondrial n=1 Tax=Plutella xylostella TaxID=51655 RepID=A0ABQ7QFX7_PLUXY|nr:hypothetical protein JYU34_011056 [Plutella xylostella]